MLKCAITFVVQSMHWSQYVQEAFQAKTEASASWSNAKPRRGVGTPHDGLETE